MINRYNGYYYCGSCYFDCDDYKGRPCEAYTPYDEEHEDIYIDMLIEDERKEFVSEWNSYLEGFYNY